MRRLFTVILAASALALYAQKDSDAEGYLDKVARDLDPGHALELRFEYSREDLQDETLLEGEGTMVLMGEKYMIDLDNVIIWFDGEKQYSLNNDIEEVYISTPDPENKEFMFSDPIRLLRDYKTKFKYRMMGDATIENISGKEVQLYPEELGGPYALIKLFFTTADKKLKGVIIRHKEGILYTMIITSQEKKDDPGTDFFKFSEEDYPMVDVIELMD